MILPSYVTWLGTSRPSASVMMMLCASPSFFFITLMSASTISPLRECAIGFDTVIVTLSAAFTLVSSAPAMRVRMVISICFIVDD